jgi:single-strand DNA-binding protein
MIEIELIGNLGARPEMRYLDNGTEITKFSIAAEAGWGEKKRTTWVRVTAFGKEAERANQYLEKGTRIWARLDYEPGENGEPRIWTGKDGVVHASLDAKLKDWRFAGGSPKEESNEVAPYLG